MAHNTSETDGFFSFVTGMTVQVIGMITFETFWIPLCLAFAGGFLGLIGKKLAEVAFKKVGRLYGRWIKRTTHQS
jgi:ubiquinone biosynthesis protein Coq4